MLGGLFRSSRAAKKSNVQKDGSPTSPAAPPLAEADPPAPEGPPPQEAAAEEAAAAEAAASEAATAEVVVSSIPPAAAAPAAAPTLTAEESEEPSAPHPVDRWQMSSNRSPLFKEWLTLAYDAGMDDLVDVDPFTLGSSDALIVVDLQNDFVPCDEVNPLGGAFGVEEGARCVPSILKLMEKFAAAGGLVVSTRDYHPAEHCSFLPCGGHFPRHCVQGSVGSYFYKPVGECMQKLRRLGRRSEVVFKGFHEAVDSFGSLQYPDNPDSLSRVANDQKCEQLHGCSLLSWTGATCLKCSNLDEDVNAPPDVMSILRRESLGDKLTAAGIERVFVCGLAMDFCVLDTALNASELKFKSIYMVLDAARAAHLPQVGKFGTGFLSDPAELKKKMAEKGVRAAPAHALASSVEASPLGYLLAADEAFPKSLGAFALAEATGLTLNLDLTALTYAAEGVDKDIVDQLQVRGATTKGGISPVARAALKPEQRKAMGVPGAATKMLWAYPVDDTADKGFDGEAAWGYFSITTPAAAFFVFGGLVFLDESNKVLSVKAFSMGTGLSFEHGRPWPGPQHSKALEGQWRPVTWNLPRTRGAKRFVWIGPGGRVSPSSGEPALEVRDGAFAFLFHEELDKHDDRDVIFHVGKASSQRRSLGVVRNLPGALVEKGYVDQATVSAIEKGAKSMLDAARQQSKVVKAKAKAKSLASGKSTDELGKSKPKSKSVRQSAKKV